jgi:hypothetical protein
MAAKPADFGAQSLGHDPVCEVAEVTAGDGRIYLRMAPAEGCPVVLILDAMTGETVGRLER